MLFLVTIVFKAFLFNREHRFEYFLDAGIIAHRAFLKGVKLYFRGNHVQAHIGFDEKGSVITLQILQVSEVLYIILLVLPRDFKRIYGVILRKQDSLKRQMMLREGQQNGNIFRLRYQHEAFVAASGEFCVDQDNIGMNQAITGDILFSLDAIGMEPGLVQKWPDGAQVFCTERVFLSLRMVIVHIQATMNVRIDEDYVKDVFGDNPVQWHVYSDAPDVVKVYQLNGLCYVQALKEGTANIYISHQYVAEDRYSELEYTREVCAVISNTRKAYYELLARVQNGDNPLNNPEICRIVQERIAEWGYSTEGINTILNCVREADEPYRSLYLYSIFDYSVEKDCECKGEDGVTPRYNVSTFEPDEKKIHMLVGKGNTYSFFHETGHAIDRIAGGEMNYTVDDELYYRLQECSKSIVINEIHTQADINKIPIIPREIDLVLYNICGARNKPFYDFTAEYKFIIREKEDLPLRLKRLYDSVLGGLDVKMALLKDFVVNGRSSAFMVIDIVTGLIDRPLEFLGELYAGHENGYFYNSDGSPNARLCFEAWAEFFSAQLTGYDKAIEHNSANFPGPCDRMKELANEMLNEYKTRYNDYINY